MKVAFEFNESDARRALAVLQLKEQNADWADKLEDIETPYLILLAATLMREVGKREGLDHALSKLKTAIYKTKVH